MEGASDNSGLCEATEHGGTVPDSLATPTGVSTRDPLTPSMIVCIAQAWSSLQPEEEESETKEEPTVAD